MKTIVIKQTGNFNLCDFKEKSEMYTLYFGGDREDRVITFDYDYDDGPHLDVDDFTVNEIIDELDGYRSKSYIFSSRFNNIGEKKHEERIALAREWAQENMVDDCRESARKLKEEADRLTKKADGLRSKAVNLEGQALELELVQP